MRMREIFRYGKCLTKNVMFGWCPALRTGGGNSKLTGDDDDEDFLCHPVSQFLCISTLISYFTIIPQSMEFYDLAYSFVE